MPGPKRFYAEHPSGYRAEWTGGARIHIYQGDAPVDSPYISGFDHSKSRMSDATPGIPHGWSQRRFEQQFHRWVRDNGDDYNDFNHPTDRPSYRERHGFEGGRHASSEVPEGYRDWKHYNEALHQRVQERKDQHRNAPRGKGRTPGEEPGDEFQDGHRLRQYPVSKGPWIDHYRVLCDACADGSPNSAAKHLVPSWSNCESPNHESNAVLKGGGVEEPTEYEEHHRNPDVVGWATDDFSGRGNEKTLCPSCAEDRRSSGHNMEPYYPLTKNRLMPQDTCDDCGHDLHQGRKEAMRRHSDYGKDDADRHGGGPRDRNNPDRPMPWDFHCAECGSGEHHTGQHRYPPTTPENAVGYVGDGIYCKNCVEHGDEKWGKPSFSDYAPPDPVSWRELRRKIPHGVECDNCYREMVPPRPHTLHECELGEDCEHAETYEKADTHLGEHDPANVRWGSDLDRKTVEMDEADWQRTLRQRKQDEGHAEQQINEMFKGGPEMNYLRGNPHGPTHLSRARHLMASRRLAYGETKAPTAVDTLRDEDCPVCGEHDAFDGDECQVCGFVSPPKMFQDPDLDAAKLQDLRQDPASGDANNQGLPPVDPQAVDQEGNIPGDPKAEEAYVEGDVEALGDEEQAGSDMAEQQMQMIQETGQPLTPEMLGPDGEVQDSNAGATGGPVGQGPEDPEAANTHFNQGGEAFTQGPNAAQPEEPMEQGEDDEEDEEQTFGQEPEDEEPEGEPQEEREQEQETQEGEDQGFLQQSEGEPGRPGDETPDLFCPSCGFESGAAHPTSSPGSAAEPANAGDGMLAGDVCPNCQKATLISVGEMQQMQGQQQGAV